MIVIFLHSAPRKINLNLIFRLNLAPLDPPDDGVVSASNDTSKRNGRYTVRVNTHTHTLWFVCSEQGEGPALSQRWLIYSLLLSVKQLTDGENTTACATVSPLWDALQFHQWQECWGTLRKFDEKVNGNYKSITVEHTVYCFVPVLTIEPAKYHLTEFNAWLICPQFTLSSGWHWIQTVWK